MVHQVAVHIKQLVFIHSTWRIYRNLDLLKNSSRRFSEFSSIGKLKEQWLTENFKGKDSAIHCNSWTWNWLVVSTPLKNISQLGWLSPIYGKIKNVPNHQPDHEWSESCARTFSKGDGDWRRATEGFNRPNWERHWRLAVVEKRISRTNMLSKGARHPNSKWTFLPRQVINLGSTWRLFDTVTWRQGAMISHV